ncbi:MAG: efflux RND transporter periplasmic adaptor subunit [Planctomycetota bacterium]|jgi:RND family efflux transporter MFP subunit
MTAMHEHSSGWWAAVLITAAFGAMPALAQNGPPPTAVTVDPVRLEPVREHRRVTGELRALRRSKVAAQEAGLVIEFPVREGHRVKAGDVLARLDSRRLNLQLSALKADEQALESLVVERKANQAWRDRELELYRQSRQRGAANPKEVLDAESEASMARARVTQAERQRDVITARAELLEERLADMTIKAPFDGIVVNRHVELGEWVSEGEAVVELVSTGQIETWLDVPQRFFGAVAGERVSIAVQVEATDQTISVTERRVIPVVDPKARSFAVVAVLDDADGTLTPGMSVTAWLPTGQLVEQLTVSKDALLRNTAGTYVYVARGGGGESTGGPASALPVSVEVLFPVGDRVVVTSRDMKADDHVVVEGNERLFPGMPIMPQVRPDDAPHAAAGGRR